MLLLHGCLNNNMRFNLYLDEVESESLEKDDDMIKQSKCDDKPHFFITGVFSQLGLDLLENKLNYDEHKILQCVDNLMIVTGRYVTKYKEMTLDKKDGILIKPLKYASEILGRFALSSILPSDVSADAYNIIKEMLKPIYTKNIKPIFSTLNDFFAVFNLSDFVLIAHDCLGKLQMPKVEVETIVGKFEVNPMIGKLLMPKVEVETIVGKFEVNPIIGSVFNSNNVLANSFYKGILNTQRKYYKIVNNTESNVFSKIYNDLYYKIATDGPNILNKLIEKHRKLFRK